MKYGCGEGLCGAWRAPAANSNAFAREQQIDIIATMAEVKVNSSNLAVTVKRVVCAQDTGRSFLR